MQEPADAFIFLGDNIYGDTEDMEVLAAKYRQLGNKEGLIALRSKVPVYAIWDDHDFGENDAGKHYPFKQASKKIMLDFWGVAKDSPRRKRTDGIYGSYVIEGKSSVAEEASGRSVNRATNAIRVILPDLRYMRDDLDSVGLITYYADRKQKGMGRYKYSEGSMMSEQQWAWLEAELKQPEKIKLIGSSLQMIADFTGWESWANFDDRRRFLGLIKKHKVNGVFIISGDTHWGEISKLEENLDYPLWDVTSSGLTEAWTRVGPNKHRVSGYTDKVNYGFFTVNWDAIDPTIHFGLKDKMGKVVIEQKTSLSSVSPY